MQKRILPALAIGLVAVLLSGCPKDTQDASKGKKEEALQDYDAALTHYEAALHADPTNIEYKLKVDKLHFEAANSHFSHGEKLRDKGDYTGAIAEFQKAAVLDPSNELAPQELQRTLRMANQAAAAAAPPPLPTLTEPELITAPPKLFPPHATIPPLRMTNDARVIFQTIGQLAGVTVIFDPDFLAQPRRITVELPATTYQQALDIAAIQAKAFWKPVTSNIVFVASGDPAKRKEYEDEVVQIFYLSNITVDKDLTEIVTAIRNLFTPALAKINVITAQNAIIVRDTPDKVMLVGKLIDRLDKAKPEVVIDVSFAEVNRDVLRNLGISGGTSVGVTFSPPSSTSSTSSSSSTSSTSSPTSVASLALNELRHLSSTDFQVTLPSATANALLTDSKTKILQNPQLRSVDGQHASLRIGDRVPVATGSFQAGIGAGVGTAGASVVSPLVNTQFQYQDVGVNVDVTPHILPDRDVAMHIKIEVSAVASEISIGGINEPEISQNLIEHDVRLKDGEVSVLGGLVTRSDTDSLNGYPGLARIPVLRYLFSGDQVEHINNELLIILTPRVVRMPQITAEDLQSIATGTDANPTIQVVEPASAQSALAAMAAPPQPGAAGVTQTNQPPAQPQQPVPVIAAGPGAIPPSSQPVVDPNAPPSLRFEPNNVALKPGETTTVAVVVNNVKDLSSIPLLLQYDPKVMEVEEARHGGFLGGGTEDAIVQRIDQAHGQAIVSVTRMPNTPGVNGTGTVVALVIKGLAPGDTQISIVQVNAKNSQQQPIPLSTHEAVIHVH
jgi:general secretion pathway protein D